MCCRHIGLLGNGGLLRGPAGNRKAYDCVMMDANHISERLGNLRQEIRDLGTVNARYRSQADHTPIRKSADSLRNERLLQIKRELADMLKRCA